jgi:PAS domain S-box-containing protein
VNSKTSFSRILPYLILILGALAINIGVGQLVHLVPNLPLFLDTIGTVLVGALLGPLAGAAVGAASNLLWGLLLGNTQAIPYAIVAAFIGWAAGFAVTHGAFERWWKALGAGFLTGVGAALISAPITAYIFGGTTGSGSDYINAYLAATGSNLLQAATIQSMVTITIDQMITYFIAWLGWRWLRKHYSVITNRSAGIMVSLQGYSLAVVISLVALLISVVFLPAFGPSIFAVFYLAVVISAWRGGMGPALFTTLVGAVSHFGLQARIFGGHGTDETSWMQFSIYVAVATAIAYIAHQLDKANRDLAVSLAAESEARARVRAITDSVNEAIALVAPDGRILEVNRRFSELFGIPAERITNIDLEDAHNFYLQVFEDGESLFHLTQAAIHDQEATDTRIIVQNWPQRRELQLFTTPVSNDGNYLGRLYVFRDVTHEREVDRMKTEFVSMVSHELRTPLTSIKGFTEMVLDGDAGEIDEEVREFLEIVYANAERLVALVNDLLDISRIESGRINLKSEPVDLQAIVQAVENTMQHKLQEKGQTLIVEIDPDAAQVIGDRDKLVQVLTNYVSNAYKYSPEGAVIRIEITRQGDHARVAVIDNGYGISPENQKQLFTKFYRVDNSLTSAIGGTGLGLSIVKQIIEMMGGEVGVESEEGVGSTFTFTVPLAEEGSQRSEVRSQRSEAGDQKPEVGDQISEVGGPKLEESKRERPGDQSVTSTRDHILVIEDDADIARLIAHRLQQAGYNTAITASAEEALGYLNDHHPDLITLDIGLPGMSGDELAARLKADITTRDIPIIVISVFADDPDNMKFAAYTLSKPIGQEELLDKVGSLLHHQQEDAVLIIEGDAAIREQLAEAISSMGHEVMLAKNGEEGLARMETSQPGVILLDLHLPDVDGFDILKRLSDNEKSAEIPVITLTADPDNSPGTRARVLALGASDLVTTPIDMDMLMQEIEIFLSTKDI